jgi:hypothetical protein
LMDKETRLSSWKFQFQRMSSHLDSFPELCRDQKVIKRLFFCSFALFSSLPIIVLSLWLKERKRLEMLSLSLDSYAITDWRRVSNKMGESSTPKIIQVHLLFYLGKCKCCFLLLSLSNSLSCVTKWIIWWEV